MIVYRIEHPEEGTGPYNTEGSHKSIITLGSSNSRPCLNVPYEIRNSWVDEDSAHYVPYSSRLYAFTSLNAFFTWWSNRDITAMHKAGFRLFVYETKPLFSDSRQCIFDARSAVKLESIPLPHHPPTPRRKRALTPV